MKDIKELALRVADLINVRDFAASIAGQREKAAA